jgi:hypothetical protein
VAREGSPSHLLATVAAVATGLGSCSFGIPPGAGEVRRVLSGWRSALGRRDQRRLPASAGVISVGYPASAGALTHQPPSARPAEVQVRRDPRA